MTWYSGSFSGTLIVEGPLEYFIAGGVGGMLGVCIGHPFDRIKMRLRGSKQSDLRTISTLIRRMFLEEGMWAFYRGMLVPLLFIAPTYGIQFGSYRIGNLVIADWQFDTHLHNFVSGCVSGVCTTPLLAPANRIKCLLKVRKPCGRKQYKGVMDVVTKLLQEGGVRNLYRGTCMQLLRDVPSSGIYFMSYESFHDVFTEHGRKVPWMGSVLITGAGAGVSAAIVSAPFDVVKNHLQATCAPKGYEYGSRDVFRELIRTEGIAGLMKSALPYTIRSLLTATICFTGFEFTRAQYQKCN